MSRATDTEHYRLQDGVVSELPHDVARYRDAMQHRRESVSRCTCGRNRPPDYDHAMDCPNRLHHPTVRAVDAYVPWRASGGSESYVVADVAGDVSAPVRTPETTGGEA